MAFSWAVRPLLDGSYLPARLGLVVCWSVTGLVGGHGPQHIQTSGAEGSVLGLSVPCARQVMTAGRVAYSSAFLIALTGVAVAQRRLDPSSSATTSTVDRALPMTEHTSSPVASPQPAVWR